MDAIAVNLDCRISDFVYYSWQLCCNSLLRRLRCWVNTSRGFISWHHLLHASIVRRRHFFLLPALHCWNTSSVCLNLLSPTHTRKAKLHDDKSIAGQQWVPVFSFYPLNFCRLNFKKFRNSSGESHKRIEVWRRKSGFDLNCTWYCGRSWHWQIMRMGTSILL